MNHPEEVRKLVAQIQKDENELQLPTFTPEDAFRLGCALREKFGELKNEVANADKFHNKYKGTVYENFPISSGIVIHIEAFTGHKLFTCTVGSASAVKPDNWIWVEGKKNVVKRFHRSSYGIGRECVLKGKTPEEAGFTLPEFSAHGGGFPIWIRGVTVAPVAVVIVSGLPQTMDHQLIVDTLRVFIPTM
ncbi:hypothetical protein CPB86DRAFT_787993 [Serendipita vermifera]|nr:hypothetical protein CPB86DRAFT_787993 [Serendipita vermifera]